MKIRLEILNRGLSLNWAVVLGSIRTVLCHCVGRCQLYTFDLSVKAANLGVRTSKLGEGYIWYE